MIFEYLFVIIHNHRIIIIVKPILFYNIIRQMEASRGTKEIECIEEEEKESAEKAHGAVNPTRFAMELFYAVSLSPFQHLNT